MNQEEIQNYISLLQRIPLFGTASWADLEEIVQSAHICQYQPGEVIIREEAEPDFFHIIVEGRVVVWQHRGPDLEEKVNEHGSPDYIGELAFLYDRLRNATCQALVAVTTLAFDKATFNHYLRTYFEREALLSQTQQNLRSLEHMPAFVDLPLDLMHKIASVAKPRWYKRGESIIGPGEQGLYFYLVEKGQVELENSATNWRRLRGEGTFFGSPDLLGDMPQSALATAFTAVSVLVIKKKDLHELLKQVQIQYCLRRLSKQLN